MINKTVFIVQNWIFIKKELIRMQIFEPLHLKVGLVYKSQLSLRLRVGKMSQYLIVVPAYP